jgi:hypothetical protein
MPGIRFITLQPDDVPDSAAAVDAARSADRLPAVRNLNSRDRSLIIPLLLSSSLLMTPVKETIWWNTPGGTVSEHRDQSAASCSLMLYDNAGSVTFQWDDPGRTLVTAVDWNWEFPDNWKIPVAMQLGNVWLSNHGGSAVIDTVGHGNAVAFATDQSVDDLLQPADHIVVRTKDSDLSINLLHSKVTVLLSRWHDCRDAIRR